MLTLFAEVFFGKEIMSYFSKSGGITPVLYISYQVSLSVQKLFVLTFYSTSPYLSLPKESFDSSIGSFYGFILNMCSSTSLQLSCRNDSLPNLKALLILFLSCLYILWPSSVSFLSTLLWFIITVITLVIWYIYIPFSTSLSKCLFPNVCS